MEWSVFLVVFLMELRTKLPCSTRSAMWHHSGHVTYSVRRRPLNLMATVDGQTIDRRVD